jgi:hypothetical protein
MVRGASDGADSSHPYGLGFATTGALLKHETQMTEKVPPTGQVLRPPQEPAGASHSPAGDGCSWAIARATNSRRDGDPDERFPGKRALTARGPAAGSGLRCRRLLAVDRRRRGPSAVRAKQELANRRRAPLRTSGSSPLRWRAARRQDDKSDRWDAGSRTLESGLREKSAAGAADSCLHAKPIVRRTWR